jgi:hypothetical protein
MSKDTVLTQFINMAAQVRLTYTFSFKEQTSCLKPLIEALRNDNSGRTPLTKDNFERIRNEIRAHSPNDSRKYEAAMEYVATHWPNWNRGQPELGPAALQQIAQLANQRQARAIVNTFNVNFQVTQTQDHNDGAGIRNFQWDVKFSLTETQLDLCVRVAVRVISAGPIIGEFRNRWATQILAAWNNRAYLVVPATGPTPLKRLPIRFEIDWRNAGDVGTMYQVNVVQPPAQPPQSKFIRSAPNRWEEHELPPTVGANAGTPHMGQWGADDHAAIVHEFGHMIGLPDEYSTLTYNGTALDGAVYNQPAFTTKSIMNNTGSEGRIHPRHYQIIANQYNLWKGITNATISG